MAILMDIGVSFNKAGLSILRDRQLFYNLKCRYLKKVVLSQEKVDDETALLEFDKATHQLYSEDTKKIGEY